jgi:mannitol-1-phosphate 5-dehydrogenase
MYGAGNIGRGFIGALLSQSGYDVTFIDVAKPVVEALQQRGSYPVRILSAEGHEDLMIERVGALDGNDRDAVARAIAEADLMATAVGANILKFIAPNIAAGLKLRFQTSDAPLNIIICENLMDANKALEKLIKAELTQKEQAIFDERVGLVEASIGRMVPVQTPDMQDGDPLRVCVERYGYLPVDRDAFKGGIPPVRSLVPYSPFYFYIRRKLYIHNMGHAACAYLGLYTGKEFIYESIDDAETYAVVLNAMMESAEVCSRRRTVFRSPIFCGIFRTF